MSNESKLPWECLDLHFSTPLITEKQPPQFNAYGYSGKANVVVKLTISGVQRVLGYFHSMNDACRYADMASLRFKDYMKSSPRYNFSEEQAIADSKDESENGGRDAGFILARLQNDFRDEGKLTEVIKRRSGEPRKRGHKLGDYVGQVRRLEVNLDAMRSRLTQLEAVVKHLSEGFKVTVNVPAPAQTAIADNTPKTIW